MTTPKRYELLKDLDTPEVRASAGIIGVQDGVRVWFGSDKRFYYYVHTVENNPTWFREVKENKEWAAFKTWLPHWVSEEDAKLLFDKQYERTDEWEVVAYKNKHTGRVATDRYSDTWRRHSIDHHPIHSVKRLGDGEVFSVGDEVEYKSADAKNWDRVEGCGTIKKIERSTFSDRNNVFITIDDGHKWHDYAFLCKYIQNIRHKDFPSVKCKLCGEVSNPSVYSGCSRHEEKGCNWYYPTTKEFVWTDALVIEYGIKCVMNLRKTTYEVMDEFKNSKQ